MITKGRMEFVEPMLIKCEEPLDKVTMQVYGGSSNGATNSSSGGGGGGGGNCNWFENLFGMNGC